ARMHCGLGHADGSSFPGCKGAVPPYERGNGEQEVGGMRRLGAIARRRGSPGPPEMGVKALPFVELSGEEQATGAIVGQGRQMSVDAAHEARYAVARLDRAPPATGRRIGLAGLRLDPLGHSCSSRPCVRIQSQIVVTTVYRMCQPHFVSKSGAQRSAPSVPLLWLLIGSEYCRGSLPRNP